MFSWLLAAFIAYIVLAVLGAIGYFLGQRRHSDTLRRISAALLILLAVLAAVGLLLGWILLKNME